MSKLTYRQQQKRLGIGIAGILFVVVLLAFGGDLIKLQPFYTPDIPGYGKTRPSGAYAPIDWRTVAQATARSADKDFPDSLKKLDGHQVVLCGYMYPTQKQDGSFDKTPVDNFLLTEQFYSRVGVGCGSGCQSPVGVKMTSDTKIPFTDWPFRVYGTLKLNPVYRGSGADVSIRDAVTVIGR